jgi:hypothetical protein
MTYSQTSLASSWSKFVTADGLGYSLGRLVLSLAISVLFFPFGLLAIAALCAALLAVPQNVMSLRPPSGPDKAALRALTTFLLLATGLPSAIGMIPSLFNDSIVKFYVESGMRLANLSFFSTVLRDWLSYFGPLEPRKGPQYALASVGIGLVLPALYAWYFPILQRYSLLRPSSLSDKASRVRELIALIWCAALTWGTIYIFYQVPPVRLVSLGILDPGTQLTYFRVPITLFCVSACLVGAFAFGALLFAFKARIFLNLKSRES